MATSNLTLRIFDQSDFKAYSSKTVIAENTTLLDSHEVDAHGEVVLHGWSPKTINFWVPLLHSADYEAVKSLETFGVTTQELWSVVSFYELKTRDLMAGDRPGTEPASLSTLKLRRWFSGWWLSGQWKEHALVTRATEVGEFSRMYIPAFYIGDARAFLDLTHEWFLYTTGRQAAIGVADEYDVGGYGILAIHHPVMGKLAASRSSIINKIEDSLSYDEKRDGLPELKICQDPDWCPKEKTAAYYTALLATGCWPVNEAMQELSVHDILSGLSKFNYVPYHRVDHLPDRAAARAKMPGIKDEKIGNPDMKQEGTPKNGSDDHRVCKENKCPDAPKDSSGITKKACNVCVDGAVKASIDRKVKSLFKNMLYEKRTTVRKQVEGRYVQLRVGDTFQGLCLDCLTKTKFESEDDDYWMHCNNFEFNHGCIVRHGQPTWYFSYMGRPEALQKWAKEKPNFPEEQVSWTSASRRERLDFPGQVKLGLDAVKVTNLDWCQALWVCNIQML